MTGALESWLETATRNLAPRAVTQISNEITAHVQSAVAQHQLEGMGEEVALELAVRELGSAKVAARGYGRVHLTVSEFQMLRRGDRTQIATRVLFIVVFLGLAAYQLRGISGPLGVSSVTMSMGIAVMSAITLLAERFERMEQRALCQLSAMVLVLICFLVAYIINLIEGLKLSSDSSFVSFGGFVFLMFTFWLHRMWSLWRKTIRITSSQLKG